MLEAVLFDMDGVLVDSEPEFYRCESELARRFGYELKPEEQCLYGGVRPLDMWTDLKERHGLSYDPQEVAEAEAEHMDRYYIQGPLHPFEPAVALLKRCAQEGLKVAVASGTFLHNVQHVIRRLGLEPYVDAVSSSSMTGNSKPKPDIFLKAMELLGVQGNACVVIEDADNGVQAARAAGVKGVIGIRFPARHQSFAGTDMIVHSLSEVDIDILRKLVE